MPKNILFIIIDQLRADSIGAAGNRVVKTPNLDRLAAEGVSFKNCYCQTAPCGPSRMSIYTGRYACSTRATNNQVPLRDAEENWGFALREAGYSPGLIGYNDYAIDPALFADDDPRHDRLSYDNVLPGFDRVYYHEYDSDEYFSWLRSLGYPEDLLSHAAIHRPAVPADGPGEHLACFYPARYKREHSECRYLTQRALEFIAASETEKGWVLSLNYIKPHPPNINCEPYRSMYDPADMPDAARWPIELAHRHPYIRSAVGAGAHVDDRHLKEFMTCYYGMISEVDDNLGLIFDELKRSGAWDETLIVVTADHGEYLGDHYLVGKGHFFDGAMRVPCIIRDPSAAADSTRGCQIDGFVETIDLSATVIEWAGIEKPDRVQGQSLIGAIHGGVEPLRSCIHYEYDYRDEARRLDAGTAMDKHLLWVVRNERYKYIQFADPDIPAILYDLTLDPDEFEDRADDPQYASVVIELCRELLRWRMYHEDQRMEHWAERLRYG